MLLFARPEHHNKIQEKLRHVLHVPFRVEHTGSHIIFYEPDGDERRGTIQQISARADRAATELAGALTEARG